MSTQNLQSAESRKINKSFFEGQSRVRYLTRDFFAPTLDLTASPPLVILAQVIHKILKVRYKYHD